MELTNFVDWVKTFHMASQIENVFVNKDLMNLLRPTKRVLIEKNDIKIEPGHEQYLWAIKFDINTKNFRSLSIKLTVLEHF